MLFELAKSGSQKVEVSEILNVNRQMIKKGYNYCDVTYATEYGYSEAYNVEITPYSVCAMKHRSIKGNKDIYKVHIEAFGTQGSISISNLTIKALYIKGDSTVLIECINDNYFIIEYEKKDVEPDDIYNDDDCNIDDYDFDSVKDEVVENIYSDDVTVQDEKGNIYNLYLDGWSEAYLYKGDTEVGFIDIRQELEDENDLHTDYYGGWTEVWQRLDHGDTDSLMERIFDEFHVEFVKNN